MIDRAVGLEQETDCQSCYTPSSDSRRLWSLWDMLAQYAWEFFILSRLLEKLHAELGVPLPKALEQPTGSVNALRALQGLGSLGSVSIVSVSKLRSASISSSVRSSCIAPTLA
jgi:hypothetical protein